MARRSLTPYVLTGALALGGAATAAHPELASLLWLAVPVGSGYLYARRHPERAGLRWLMAQSLQWPSLRALLPAPRGTPALPEPAHVAAPPPRSAYHAITQLQAAPLARSATAPRTPYQITAADLEFLAGLIPAPSAPAAPATPLPHRLPPLPPTSFHPGATAQWLADYFPALDAGALVPLLAQGRARAMLGTVAAWSATLRGVERAMVGLTEAEAKQPTSVGVAIWILTVEPSAMQLAQWRRRVAGLTLAVYDDGRWALFVVLAQPTQPVVHAAVGATADATDAAVHDDSPPRDGAADAAIDDAHGCDTDDGAMWDGGDSESADRSAADADLPQSVPQMMGAQTVMTQADLIAALPVAPSLGTVLESQEDARNALRLLFGIVATTDPATGAAHTDLLWFDLTAFTHLGVFGQSGCGKDGMISGWLYVLAVLHDPTVVQFAIADPKNADYRFCQRLPHMLQPVASDPEAIAALLHDLLELVLFRANVIGTAFPEGGMTLDDVNRLSTATRQAAWDTVAAAWDAAGRSAPAATGATTMSHVVVVVTEALILDEHAEAAKLIRMARVAGVHLIVSAQEAQGLAKLRKQFAWVACGYVRVGRDGDLVLGRRAGRGQCMPQRLPVPNKQRPETLGLFVVRTDDGEVVVRSLHAGADERRQLLDQIGAQYPPASTADADVAADSVAGLSIDDVTVVMGVPDLDLDTVAPAWLRAVATNDADAAMCDADDDLGLSPLSLAWLESLEDTGVGMAAPAAAADLHEREDTVVNPQADDRARVRAWIQAEQAAGRRVSQTRACHAVLGGKNQERNNLVRGVMQELAAAAGAGAPRPRAAPPRAQPFGRRRVGRDRVPRRGANDDD